MATAPESVVTTIVVIQYRAKLPWPHGLWSTSEPLNSAREVSDWAVRWGADFDWITVIPGVKTTLVTRV